MLLLLGFRDLLNNSGLLFAETINRSRHFQSAIEWEGGLKDTGKSILVTGGASVNTFDSDLKGCEPTTVSNELLIPIFILVRDRLSSLKLSIDSYRKFTSAHEIIVLDHNSTYPPMVEYLKNLTDTGEAQVHHIEAHDWDQVLKDSADYIESYLSTRVEIHYYVYTDADVAFLRSAPDTLLFYAGVLSSCKHINVVGPQLQISDIPDHYANKPEVLVRHGQKQKFWITPPSMATWNKIGYHIGVHPIDTTFAMRRRGYPFARKQKPAVRAFAPHAAVHVDWYHNSSSPPEDLVYYKAHLEQPGVSHWRRLELKLEQ